MPGHFIEFQHFRIAWRIAGQVLGLSCMCAFARLQCKWKHMFHTRKYMMLSVDGRCLTRVTKPAAKRVFSDLDSLAVDPGTTQPGYCQPQPLTLHPSASQIDNILAKIDAG